MKVKFIVPDWHGTNYNAYFHTVLVLAEGCKGRGVEFYGNMDYWFDFETKEYLIKKSPKDFNADVHIYSAGYFDKEENFDTVDYSKKNVAVDSGDGMFTHFQNPKFRDFTLILKNHFNSNYNYPENVKPWSFGLSKRMLEAVDKTRVTEQANEIMVNFRGNHTLRILAMKGFEGKFEGHYDLNSQVDKKVEWSEIKGLSEVKSKEESYWLQTGQRHNENYFRRMNSTMFTMAFGGFVMLKPIRPYKNKFPYKQIYKRQVLWPMARVNARRYFLYQYDSWRLWEAFYSNSIPVHLDFEEWGVELPAMPENGKHYIGVKNFDFGACADHINAMSKSEVEKMALEGKKWAEENYSPGPMFDHLLTYLGEK